VTQFRFSRLAAASIAAGTFLTAPLAANAQTIEVTKMCACWVTGLSADGHAATGMTNSNFATFRWTQKDGVKTLGRNTAKFLQGQTAGVPAISDDGRTIAATIMDDTNTYGTEGLWTVGAGWQQLGPMPPDGGIMDSFDSSVFGMSGDGKTVTGLYWRPGQQGGSAHGSVWTAATGVVGMPTAGRSSRIDGANRDGTVLVGWEEDPQTGVRMAAVWVNGVKTMIDDGGGVGWPSEASSVNGDGTIIVGQAVDVARQQEAAVMWKWDGTTWQKTILGLGPNDDGTGSAYALGVSDDGSVVVGMYRNNFWDFSDGGFLWTQDAGLVDAQSWLIAQGFHVDKRMNVFEVTAITHDGKTMSMVAQQNKAPYEYRSLLVARTDGARIR
jgi:uncharacterized membrane protein